MTLNELKLLLDPFVRRFDNNKAYIICDWVPFQPNRLGIVVYRGRAEINVVKEYPEHTIPTELPALLEEYKIYILGPKYYDPR